MKLDATDRTGCYLLFFGRWRWAFRARKYFFVCSVLVAGQSKVHNNVTVEGAPLHFNIFIFLLATKVRYLCPRMQHGGSQCTTPSNLTRPRLSAAPPSPGRPSAQFTSVANVTFPGVYQRFLNGLDIFNFDLGWVLSAGCVVDVNFHDRLLMSTIGPILAVLFLAATYAAAARINRGHAEALQVVWNKHVSMLVLLTFFIYSSVSSTLFKMFACENLDDGAIYLRADYRIQCDSPKHRAFQVYAGLMIVLYTVGIPVFYSVLLFRDRQVLRQEDIDREETARISSTSDLWKPYRPSVFYYEVIECGRRVLLAGIVVFIYPNTAAQIAITLMIAVVFAIVSEALSPYESGWDTWISRMGHAVIAVSMYVALLLKVDVSNERDDSQKLFEAFLVTAHGCMILSVILETVIVACAVRAEQRGKPTPRFRGSKYMFRGRTGVAAATNNPFSPHVYRSGGGAPPG